MAKLTLGKISSQQFTTAMQTLLGKTLPARTAYKIKGLVEKFNGELKKFSDLRKEILERYCKKGEDGKPLLDNGNYSFDDGKLDEMQKEMSELVAIEVEFAPIKLDELGNIELSAQQIFDLGEVVSAE